MKDFIFITRASGIGKTTLANGLLEHYKTTCIEQHMVPAFVSRDGNEPMTGELEELTCWENQSKKYGNRQSTSLRRRLPVYFMNTQNLQRKCSIHGFLQTN